MGRSSGWLRALLRRLLAAAFAVALALGLAEGGLRLLGLFPPAAVHRLAPNASSRDVQTDWDVTYRTNSLGLRDDEHPRRRPDGVANRIVVVGDSFTFGQGVERQDGFGAVLQQVLGDDGYPAEVINVSNIGLGPEGYFVLLRDLGLPFEPDVVVVNLFGNDGSATAQSSPLRLRLRELSHTFRLLSLLRVVHRNTAEVETMALVEPARLWDRLRESCATRLPADRCETIVRDFVSRFGPAVNNLAAAALTDPEEVRRWVYADAEIVGFRELEDYVSRMADLCRRHGARLVLGVVPDGVQVSSEQIELRRRLGLDYPDAVLIEEGRFQRLVCDLARRLEAGCYDPLDTFRRGPPGSYFAADLHWTAAGHRIYGEGLAAFLESAGFLKRAEPD